VEPIDAVYSAPSVDNAAAIGIGANAAGPDRVMERRQARRNLSRATSGNQPTRRRAFGRLRGGIRPWPAQ
jgi:hypothetical protein